MTSFIDFLSINSQNFRFNSVQDALPWFQYLFFPFFLPLTSLFITFSFVISSSFFVVVIVKVLIEGMRSQPISPFFELFRVSNAATIVFAVWHQEGRRNRQFIEAFHGFADRQERHLFLFFHSNTILANIFSFSDSNS